MKKRFFVGAVALAAGALLSGPAVLAQTGYKAATDKNMERASSESRESSSAARLSASDKSFVKNAAAGGLAEVELGRLAAERASDPDVRQFGQKMVDDHSKANEDLKSLAQTKGVDVSDKLDAKSQAEYDRLSKLSGRSFDRAYMKLMVSDHEKDVSEFRKVSRSAKDMDVRSFASNKLPTLQEHLKLAHQDNSKVAMHGKTMKSEKTSS